LTGSDIAATTASAPPLSALHRHILPLYILFFLSGATGLVYEVMWTRGFSLVFGSTTRAAAAVLAAFFAGMALGNWLGGRLARRPVRALRRYGVAELFVAVTALLVGIWLVAYERFYPQLYQWAGSGGALLTAAKLALAFVALAPPCMAMGATLPLMSQAVVQEQEHIGRRLAGIYGVNTIGATLGVLLAGFYLPISIGTRNTVYLAAALNVAIGIVAVWWGVRRAHVLEARSALPEPATGRLPRRRSAATSVLVAVMSGLGTLALEVLFTRLLMNESDCSVYSFAVMLATFLVFLAFGSLAVSAIIDHLRRPWLFVALTQAAAAAAVICAPRLFFLSIMHAGADPPASTFDAMARLLGRAALVMGPAVLLAGVALPAAWKLAARAAAEAGQRVGFLTGWNTIAAVVGSVAAGFFIIPRLGLGGGFVLVGVLYGVLSMVAWTQVYDDHRRRNACVAVGALLVLLYLLRVWQIVPILPKPGDRLVHYHEGESATVAVFADARGDRYLTVNSHYILGGSSPAAVELQRMQGTLPLRLHPQPRSVAFIGVATGISVSSIQDFPVERVVALELIPGVVEAAEFFAAENRRVLHDPRVETLIADGRNHLYATDERFDVIVGDLFIPWEAGTGYLYTDEHFRNIARHLRDGGVFGQWLPAYQLSLEEVRIIAATFTDVFPRATCWLYDYGPAPVVALIANTDAEAVSRTPIGDAATPAWTHVRYVCDGPRLRAWCAAAPRNTDTYPRIEFAAAAGHFSRATTGAVQLRESILELRSP